MSTATFDDVSERFVFNEQDSKLLRRIIRHEATPMAILEFARKCRRLSDYAYWFTLGTLWVNYTGHSDLNLWKRLFSSSRPGREDSLMKPSELTLFHDFPDRIICYRAHRPGEKDWIAYTFNPDKAGLFASLRNVNTVTEYIVEKHDVLAMFTRRGEAEVLVLDKNRVAKVRDVPVIAAAL